ncbi:hypothetical protein B0H14DRAFT_1578586 [Mycena olivaceomarginata]|nr:hypothetical protein B0H14DRAFT_1578586 [Mycena olivaceomarginata]
MTCIGPILPVGLQSPPILSLQLPTFLMFSHACVLPCKPQPISSRANLQLWTSLQEPYRARISLPPVLPTPPACHPQATNRYLNSKGECGGETWDTQAEALCGCHSHLVRLTHLPHDHDLSSSPSSSLPPPCLPACCLRRRRGDTPTPRCL